MSKPNVTARTREVGFVAAQSFGNLAVGSSGINPGNAAPGVFPLNAGAQADSFGFQVNHAILGGASVLFFGNSLPPTIRATRHILNVHDTHCVNVEVRAHLRSAGNVDLPGLLRFFFNELAPEAAVVPAPDQSNLGDWAQGQWQEWEDWSPLTVPTPPPGFTAGGAGGLRYEYRRVLGRVPGNFMYASITNLGTVAATEWGLAMILRSSPPVYTR